MDVATLQAGRWVENKLAERDRDGRPRYTIEELIGERGRGGEREFRKLAASGARKVRIKEDGTWD